MVRGEDPGLGICPVQIVPLNGEQLLRVRLRSAEGGDPRQGQNLLRFVPGLDGEEHVRAHQQPQLVLRVPLLQLGQGGAVPQFGGLEHRDVVDLGAHLHRGGLELHPPVLGLVRLAKHAHHLVAGGDQRL